MKWTFKVWFRGNDSHLSAVLGKPQKITAVEHDWKCAEWHGLTHTQVGCADIEVGKLISEAQPSDDRVGMLTVHKDLIISDYGGEAYPVVTTLDDLIEAFATALCCYEDQGSVPGDWIAGERDSELGQLVRLVEWVRGHMDERDDEADDIEYTQLLVNAQHRLTEFTKRLSALTTDIGAELAGR